MGFSESLLQQGFVPAGTQPKVIPYQGGEPAYAPTDAITHLGQALTVYQKNTADRAKRDQEEANNDFEMYKTLRDAGYAPDKAFDSAKNRKLTGPGGETSGDFEAAKAKAEIAKTKADTKKIEEGVSEVQKLKQQQVMNSGRLRKELQDRPEVKTFVDLKTQLNLMDKTLASLKNGTLKSPNAVDQVLVNTFGRMMDPGVSVREVEFARTPENMALMGKIDAYIERIKKGGLLNDTERDEMVKAAKIIANERGKKYNETMNGFKDIAIEQGLPVNWVTQGLQEHLDLFPEQNQIQTDEYIKKGTKPDGTRIGVLPDGTIEIIKEEANGE